jgi:purine-binding chemotaxis protein CheW
MQSAVLITVKGSTCALPLEQVIEVMRVLPVVPVDNPPPFSLGAALVRGEPLPVVDLAAVLGSPNDAYRRFVRVRVRNRSVVLAVDDVLGIRRFDAGTLDRLPPLLQADDGHGAVAALAVRDRELYLVLDSSRLLPPETPSVDAA